MLSVDMKENSACMLWKESPVNQWNSLHQLAGMRNLCDLMHLCPCACDTNKTRTQL